MARKPQPLKSSATAKAISQPHMSQFITGGQVRRSSRRMSSNPNYADNLHEDEAVDGQDAGSQAYEHEGRRAISSSRKIALKNASEDSQVMEGTTLRAKKRQRLQLSESLPALNTRYDIEDDDYTNSLPSQLTGKTLGEKQPRSKKGTGTAAGKPLADRDEDGDDAYIASDGVGENEADATLEIAERGAARTPAVNSSYLPLPWKGRLGYACLNTYLRSAKPSVFCSRTCRMASIIEHRHPLQDMSQPEHSTKNRPDKSQKADIALGQKYVQDLGLANGKDLVKMLRWNDKYNIKFMRLSSEMFPFASHPEHGYSLAPFASEVLADAGRIVAELGHRVTMHPGQFTQLGSPRKEVISGSVRDLQYHDELLSLLKLPEQQNRDAVMIIHMGGVFGDKRATLDRFRENYTNLLSPSIKARLVLENDDVSWSVHDLLPVCEELNIPMVLDFHHHNIVFEGSKMREGTYDISQPEIMDRILATWRRKGITPKMHYSEQCAGAVTPRERRKHSPRVMTLPPCPPDMDLMIEAKDKEQAVFELMRTFKLPGFETINDLIPHERDDEDRAPAKVPKSKTGSVKRKKVKGREAEGVEDSVMEVNIEMDERDKDRSVAAEEFAMGGPQNRVYWPLGMEDWLKPKKRESNKAKLDAEEEA